MELLPFHCVEGVYPASEKVRTLIRNEISSSDISELPDSKAYALKSALSSYHSVPLEQIVIGCGSDEFIEILPRLFLQNTKHQSLIVVPTFPRFILAHKRNNCRYSTVRCQETDVFQFTPSLIGQICKSIKEDESIRLVWLCSPCNPTGSVMSPNAIKKIAETRAEVNVIIDEAFMEYYDLTGERSAMRLVEQYPNIIVLRTFSKAFGLGGLRVGYACSSYTIVEQMDKMRLYYNVSSVAQKSACVALDDVQYIQDVITSNKEETTRLFSELETLENVRLVKNKDDISTNFFMVKHLVKNLFSELRECGIQTQRLDTKDGLEGLGYVRVAVRTKDENEKLLEALRIIS